MNKSEFGSMIANFRSNTGSSFTMARCIYENDDILVDHTVTRYPDGSRESLIRVRIIGDGKIIRMEIGALLMKT